MEFYKQPTHPQKLLCKRYTNEAFYSIRKQTWTLLLMIASYTHRHGHTKTLRHKIFKSNQNQLSDSFPHILQRIISFAESLRTCLGRLIDGLNFVKLKIRVKIILSELSTRLLVFVEKRITPCMVRIVLVQILNLEIGNLLIFHTICNSGCRCKCLFVQRLRSKSWTYKSKIFHSLIH